MSQTNLTEEYEAQTDDEVEGDRERIGEHRYYRVPVPAGQELRAAVSISLDRALAPDYGVLLKATTIDGRELVRGGWRPGAPSARN